MQERTGLVRHGSLPLTLIGAELKPGDKAPAFTLADNNLQPFSSDKTSGKVCVISCVPSLDTPTCDIETRRFNTEAAKLGPDV
ncbi:MAG TPA: redoxin family protein, partial [Elusimicrobiales bacterium]|nr:redoxin family protein [Elusimicrobiales bacterium]